MRLKGALKIAAAAALLVAASQFALAQDIFLRDIFAHPERFYNLPVTVSGTVQAVQANPVGTQRGQYTITDDSSTTALAVKTERLPKIGETYKIRGILVADPARDNVPMLKEDGRSSTGSNSTTIILVLAGLVFLVLLVLLLRLMSKSKTGKRGAPVIKPVSKAPAAGSPDLAKTIRVAPGGEPVAAKTQIFLNLGASIIVDKGADAGKEFPLHTLSTAIGRPGARKNDIELTDGTVSKEQASINYDNTKKEFTLVNESQTNPTRVNQVDIAVPTVITDGAVIEIGKTVLRFKKG
jgi:pSer/pThr/pTyr-binding forkhead associated (FHA) protein